MEFIYCTLRLIWLSLAFEPCLGQWVIVKHPLGLLQDELVVGIQPFLLFLSNKRHINQLSTVRGNGDILEAQKGLIAKLELRLDILDDDDVLDANTERPVFVVTRLVRKDLASCEGYFSVVWAVSDTHGAFVNVQVRANAMARAMPEVKADSLSFIS